jgi:catechol 2,3-dioxygenase-like lactoylglutathione lyase family enzyme
MSDTQVSTEAATDTSGAAAVPMRLEVVVFPVTDANRTKSFYEGLGWRLDADISVGDYHGVQVTPPGSQASIIFGEGVSSDEPRRTGSLLLAVDDIDAARDDLISHGVEVSEVFHDAGGGLGGGLIAGTESRAPGRDPEGRSYASYAEFSDPDGNSWLLQEITERLPGRV